MQDNTKKEEKSVGVSFKVRKDLLDRLKSLAGENAVSHSSVYLVGMLYIYDVINKDPALAEEVLGAIRYSRDGKNKVIDNLFKEVVKKSIRKAPAGGKSDDKENITQHFKLYR